MTIYASILKGLATAPCWREFPHLDYFLIKIQDFCLCKVDESEENLSLLKVILKLNRIFGELISVYNVENCLSYDDSNPVLFSFVLNNSGLTFLGLQQDIFHFTVVQITMIIIIMLADKARVILLQYSPIAITYMELTR
ncbi:Hypothetical predicted protein [Olea europaea subsp. europaea]|nr:Hypothetical predicted protein [Olea europaea subsp. europaea]